MTSTSAAVLPPSSLQLVPLERLCTDNVSGFCRRGDRCLKSHEICAIPSDTLGAPTIQSEPNRLLPKPRGSLYDKRRLEDDWPGELSSHGPRHDNDYVSIKDIKILPTTDEILSTRTTHMPKKGDFARHRLPLGQGRLLDVQFRQLRFENTESIIDCCYHASQQLFRFVMEPEVTDYDDRLTTPRGCKYSLFRYVGFEELTFHYQRGITLRLSFTCPRTLRGTRLGASQHLEEGMLVALIGIDSEKSLSTIFMQIVQRQTTSAMRPRTGNDLRGKSCPLNPLFD